MNLRLPATPVAALAAALLAMATTSPAASAADESALFQPIPTVQAASRFEQPGAEAPSSVSVITRDDIWRNGYRTLGAIIDSVNGFTLSSDRNYSYVGVRGFPRAGGYNTRILVLLDGQRINDSLYEDAGYGNEALVDVAVIDRVEVIRGPGSAAYGSGAFFATINVITRRGRDLDGTQVAGGAGGLGTRELRLGHGRRLDSGLEYLFSASAYTSKGQESLFFPAFNTPANNNGIAQNADGEDAQHVYGKLRWGDLTVALAAVQRVKHVPTASFSTVFNDNRFLTNDERAVLQARHTGRFGESAEVHTSLSLNTSRYRGYYPASLPPVVINRDEGISDSWNIESYAAFEPWREHRVTAGFDHRRNMRLEQNNADTTQHLQVRNASTVNGLFVQDEWRLHERALLNLGLRQDRYTAFGASTSPRGALILRARPDTTVKLMTGRAFRVPNAYEMYYSDGSLQFGNAFLRPERSLTREVVVEYAPTPRLSASAGMHRYRITDFIRQVTDPDTSLRTFRNAAHVDSTGYAFEVAWQDEDGRQLRGSYSRQRMTDDTNGARLAGSPAWTAKLNASQPFTGFRGRASLAGRLVSARSTLIGQPLPSYAVFDLTVQAVVPALPNLRLSATLYNLFDRRYADSGALEHTQDSIPADGRVLFGRAEIVF